jgi:hypothetical protein
MGIPPACPAVWLALTAIPVLLLLGCVCKARSAGEAPSILWSYPWLL